MIRNNTPVIYMGLIWGIAELVPGYFLHLLKSPVTGSLLMPVGIICMIAVYMRTGSKSATVFTSVIAASVKLITILIVPVSSLYLVVNPVVAILLEGLIIIVPISLTDKKISDKLRYNLLLYFGAFYLGILFYKICFLIFQNVLRAETGAPALGGLNIADNFNFFIIQTFISTFLIACYLWLRLYVKEAISFRR